MKRTLAAIATGTVLSIGGIASAAEPVQLTDTQMDAVAAGQYSHASSGGSAWIGIVFSTADSGSYSSSNWCYTVKVTNASAGTLSFGAGASAHASAGSGF